jgi:hypothetical protein
VLTEVRLDGVQGYGVDGHSNCDVEDISFLTRNIFRLKIFFSDVTFFSCNVFSTDVVFGTGGVECNHLFIFPIYFSHFFFIFHAVCLVYFFSFIFLFSLLCAL